MNFIAIIFGSFFALVSSAVLAHISMATPMGPWIAPAVVLIAGVLLRMFGRGKGNERIITKDLVLIQAAAAGSGVIAIGIGFTLPMLYFLNPDVFNSWLANPYQFCLILGSVSLTAGGLGMWLGKAFSYRLLVKEKLAFPVSDLIAQTITSQSQKSLAWQLGLGYAAATTVSFFRDGIFHIKGMIPRVLYIAPQFTGKEFAVGISPMYWAMGFIAGMDIVFPLLLGMLSRYLIIYPLNNHAHYLPITVFGPFTFDQFAVAFCSGLVVTEMVFTLIRFPKTVWGGIKKYSGYNFLNALKEAHGHMSSLFKSPHAKSSTIESRNKWMALWYNVEPLMVVIGSWLVLRAFGFSIVTQLFMLVLLVIFTYQISYFSGKVGLVPFGRFATFVMIPTMLLFKLDFVQITILSVFANICFAAATDLLFDIKVGELCDVDKDQIYRYQWLGIIVTSIGIGFFFWLLLTHFSLGTADMFAHRARARALLIQSISFDIEPVILGFLFGLVLRRFKLNPMMVFGGILMPTETTIGLMVGALISWFDKKNKEHIPFWSGIFAGESIWVLSTLILKMC